MPEPNINQEDGHLLVTQAIEPTDELVSLFELAITRHIKAKGYPQHPQLDPLVNEEGRAQEAESNTIRARKLLKFASGSELMPLGLWSLLVRSSVHLHKSSTHHHYGSLISDQIWIQNIVTSSHVTFQLIGK
jgi:hypothetical protein